jgi:hypothetical protein
MSVFTDLDRQWQHISTTPAAHTCYVAWTRSEPSLAAYRAPAALVAAITARRGTATSARLLRALLQLADDPFAARTALQALLPALRAERVLQPRYGHLAAERWTTPEDTFADLVGAAWEAIRAHAGETHDDPERLVVRSATRRLRTVRQAHVRHQRRCVPLDPARHDRGVQLDQARTTAERATLILIDAVRAGQLQLDQARLLHATSVAGLAAIDAAAHVTLPKPRAVYYALQLAQTTLAATPA